MTQGFNWSPEELWICPERCRGVVRGLKDRKAANLVMRITSGMWGCGCYGRYLLLPPPRLPSLRARYHFLLAHAEAGMPRISPVSSQGAPMKPVQLITSHGTVTARYSNKKEPTPQVTALPGISTYWPLPLVSCRAMKPGAIPTASAVKNNHSKKVNVFTPLAEKCPHTAL